MLVVFSGVHCIINCSIYTANVHFWRIYRVVHKRTEQTLIGDSAH